MKRDDSSFEDVIRWRAASGDMCLSTLPCAQQWVRDKKGAQKEHPGKTLWFTLGSFQSAFFIINLMIILARTLCI